MRRENQKRSKNIRKIKLFKGNRVEWSVKNWIVFGKWKFIDKRSNNFSIFWKPISFLRIVNQGIDGSIGKKFD